MLVRWLLPVIAAFAVLAGSVTAYAAAGMIGETACCCPDPEACKCHDHDQDDHPAPELKKCGGTAELVAPAIAVATLPAPALATVPRTTIVVVHVTPLPPEPRDTTIETPPF